MLNEYLIVINAIGKRIPYLVTARNHRRIMHSNSNQAFEMHFINLLEALVEDSDIYV